MAWWESSLQLLIIFILYFIICKWLRAFGGGLRSIYCRETIMKWNEIIVALTNFRQFWSEILQDMRRLEFTKGLGITAALAGWHLMNNYLFFYTTHNGEIVGKIEELVERAKLIYLIRKKNSIYIYHWPETLFFFA